MQKLLKQCRYYKGESKCPDSVVQAGKANIWYYESIWVEKYGQLDNSWEYHTAGLDEFSQDDDVPVSLKQLLFNRFIQDSSLALAAEPFKERYFKYYMSNNLPVNVHGNIPV